VVALSDRRKVVSVSWDETLRVWDVDTGECVRELEGHSGVSEC
jgi:WD40 repeat protein